MMAHPAERRISVVVTVVDSQRHWLTRCVDAIRAQTVGGIELVVVDNSTDQDIEVGAGGAIDRVLLVRNPVWPTFFCDNYNLGIRHATGDPILVLNLDAFPSPGFLERVRAALDERRDVAIVSGKLLRLDENGVAPDPPIIDSAGMILTLDQRHLDRGTGSRDRGQYDRGEYIFGSTGAALTIRRAALDELALDGDCFDADFVHGREDGDLCLRAQLQGWRAWYEPAAVAHHVRTMRHGERRALSPLINRHQVKNRYLLRVNNLPLLTQVALAPAFLLRDAQALAYMLVAERTSLSALTWLWRERRRLLAKRQRIQARRKATARHMIGLFFTSARDRMRYVGRGAS